MTHKISKEAMSNQTWINNSNVKKTKGSFKRHTEYYYYDDYYKS